MTSSNKLPDFRLILSGLIIIIITNNCEHSLPSQYLDYTGQKGKVNDLEGNIYKTIGIGTQIWMAENLRSTKLNDNTEALNLTDSLDWVNLSFPGYCWYNNDTALKIPYGALYNWHAVNSGNLCPKGWHVPTESEWTTLMDKLGGKQVAGGKLKVIGTDYWNSPNNGTTNSSQFNAVPSGGIFYGHFWSFGKWCHLWSITQIDTVWVTTVSLLNLSPGALIGPGGTTNFCGLSVRCIKDQETD
jgi:uncharacterized protein (TIGR02145 family)